MMITACQHTTIPRCVTQCVPNVSTVIYTILSDELKSYKT